jgi:hypothetical protein
MGAVACFLSRLLWPELAAALPSQGLAAMQPSHVPSVFRSADPADCLCHFSQVFDLFGFSHALAG